MNWTLLIGGVTWAVFVIGLSLYFWGKRQYRSRQAEKHYVDVDEESTGIGAGFLTSLVVGFVVILVGVNLIPVVSYQVQLAQTNLTDNPSVSAILGLKTIFFALAIMVAGITLAVSGLKKGGLIF